MSNYKFGQFRREQASSFLKVLEYSIGDTITTTPFSKVITFKDAAINLTGSNVLQSTDSTRTKSRNYYIKYRIYKKQDSDQVITIKLVNTNKTTDNEQTLNTITVPRGKEDEFFAFDLVISPNSTYNQILFLLNRNSEDFVIENEDGSYGRKVKLEVEYYEEVINVIDTYLNASINNAGILKQIGVQGPPGMLMCIEGEGIRVGRSGIYEINNGVFVTFLGFIIQDDEQNHFFLDYQY